MCVDMYIQSVTVIKSRWLTPVGWCGITYVWPESDQQVQCGGHVILCMHSIRCCTPLAAYVCVCLGAPLSHSQVCALHVQGRAVSANAAYKVTI